MLNITFAANAISAKKVIEMIEAGVREFIDEHNSQSTAFENVILMKNHKGEVVNICPMLIDEVVYSLNPLTVRDGKLYMSKWSCGGTLDLRGCAVESLAIDRYNRETTLGGGSIEMLRLAADEVAEATEEVLTIPTQKSECADFAHKAFIYCFNAVADVVEYDPKWENGTGYLDHAVKVLLPSGKMAKTIDPQGRRIILCGTRFGSVAIFERFADRAPIVANAPRKLSAFLPTGVWSEEDVSRNLIGGNIGESIEALFE